MVKIGWLDIDPVRRAELECNLERNEDVRHRKAFDDLYADFTRRLSTRERRDVRAAEEKSATVIGHKPKYNGIHVTDQYCCSCGWATYPYLDGEDWAWQEWRWHMLKAGVVVEYPRYPRYEPLERLLVLKNEATQEQPQEP